MGSYTIQSPRTASRNEPAGWGCRDDEPTTFDTLDEAIEAVAEMPPGKYRVLEQVPYSAPLVSTSIVWQGTSEDARRERRED